MIDLLDALNAIVEFLGGLVNLVAEFNAYSLAFLRFLWSSVEISMDFLVLIPEPFLHFAYITLVLAALGFVLKVVL